MRISLIFLSFIVLMTSCGVSQTKLIEGSTYICKRTLDEINIDGSANESSWNKASWTQNFVDIEGDKNPAPYLNTRAKMLWDDDYFYFYAEMEEPHIWAKLTERDAVIFYDNDFEIFIDPDGDTHNYTEFEMNAFNTVWDLLLTKPYRDGGHAVNAYDIQGLKTAVKINGSINDPSDKDKSWSIEVAIPWKVLKETTKTNVPPKHDDIWRVNFSRVQWETEIQNGEYVKKKNLETGKNLPENNWVWSPQRAIAMHEPEFWGRVIFTDLKAGESTDFVSDYGAEEIRQTLYQVHRQQKAFKKENGVYNANKQELIDFKKFSTGSLIFWELIGDKHSYHAVMSHPLNTTELWHIDQTGRLWKEIKK